MDFKTLFKYINYQLTSYTEHDVHSPFVYNFYMELIKNPHPFGDFEELNKLRNRLLSDTTQIEFTDFGAGSKKLSKKDRTRIIKEITKHGIAQKKQAEFLYRLLNKFSPKTIIELGTSVGLTSLYLAKASPKSHVYTIEGCPNLYQFSQAIFQEKQIENIQAIKGHFNDELPKLLSKIDTIDFLYIDGNHAYEPTLQYFDMALKKKNGNSIFVFDDIYWSEGMQKAWKEICAHPDVTLSLDLFYFGIVFFRTETKNKEHFVLKF